MFNPLVPVPGPDPLFVKVVGPVVHLDTAVGQMFHAFPVNVKAIPVPLVMDRGIFISPNDGSTLRFYVVAYGGEDRQVKATVVSAEPGKTTTVAGKSVFPTPPANYEFTFSGLPAGKSLQLVVDATDKAGRAARDVVNFVLVSSPHSGFDIFPDVLANRVDGSCDVFVYGTASLVPATVYPAETKIVNNADPAVTVGGAGTDPGWWAWAAQYKVPQNFPTGDATLYVTCKGPEAGQKDTEDMQISIAPCGGGKLPPGP